jgi:photosystem II stability/assembly factor-like uncharacterized protein
MRGLVLTIVAVSSSPAQWTVQQSHTSASLRGIHNVGSGVVWASGSQGTVLHTINDGQAWQTCAIPPGAENLDFRGIQAFDADTAIVMSSGVGGLSRLYKTMDACRTWRLVFTNPDPSGFWDAMQFSNPAFGALIGDQVHGHFPVFFSTDAGDTWRRFDPKALSALDEAQSFFAASNTALLVDARNAKLYMVTGGGTTSLITVNLHRTGVAICKDCLRASYTHLDMATGETAGGFSLAARASGSNLVMVAVGGDYKAPEQTTGTAAFWIDDDRHNRQWHASDTPPSGYRSAVAYYAPGKLWITVGPGGTDISTDDGRNWRGLRPGTEDTPDANKNWNALSLPFVAGSNGRIGKLNPHALRP